MRIDGRRGSEVSLETNGSRYSGLKAVSGDVLALKGAGQSSENIQRGGQVYNSQTSGIRSTPGPRCVTKVRTNAD